VIVSHSRIEIASTIMKADHAFAALIYEIGPPPVRRSAPVATRFSFLARCITFQLLATKAAETIHQRIIELCGGDVRAEGIISLGHLKLREVGLSNAKAAAMLELAERTRDGRLHLERHGTMSDVQIISDLITVRGIGTWTAQMYLMNALARRDVWPSGDFGVRNGWSLLHARHDVIGARELHVEGERFSGVRSDVAWYCWRAVEHARAVTSHP